MIQHEKSEGGQLHVLTLVSGGKPLKIYIAEPREKEYDLGKSPSVRQSALHHGRVFVNGGVTHLGHNHPPMNVGAGENFSIEVIGLDHAVLAVLDHGSAE